jgi:hypothetical protein
VPTAGTAGPTLTSARVLLAGLGTTPSKPGPAWVQTASRGQVMTPPLAAGCTSVLHVAPVKPVPVQLQVLVPMPPMMLRSHFPPLAQAGLQAAGGQMSDWRHSRGAAGMSQGRAGLLVLGRGRLHGLFEKGRACGHALQHLLNELHSLSRLARAG